MQVNVVVVLFCVNNTKIEPATHRKRKTSRRTDLPAAGLVVFIAMSVFIAIRLSTISFLLATHIAAPRPNFFPPLPRHLDDLFSELLFAGVFDLFIVFSEPRLPFEHFTKTLETHLAPEPPADGQQPTTTPWTPANKSLDWGDVRQAAGHVVNIAELNVAYKEFLTRYGVLVSEIARRMDSVNVSSYELFAAVKRAKGAGGAS